MVKVLYYLIENQTLNMSEHGPVFAIFLPAHIVIHPVSLESGDGNAGMWECVLRSYG
jgi:hypothetical protein